MFCHASEYLLVALDELRGEGRQLPNGCLNFFNGDTDNFQSAGERSTLLYLVNTCQFNVVIIRLKDALDDCSRVRMAATSFSLRIHLTARCACQGSSNFNGSSVCSSSENTKTQSDRTTSTCSTRIRFSWDWLLVCVRSKKLCN